MKRLLSIFCGLAWFAVAYAVDCDTVACGAVYPDRYDDLAWENDIVAFRAYGPGLQNDGQRLYGYDIFLKRNTTQPVLATMYHDFFNGKTYHKDHGYGLDCYAVGPTLGAGCTAVIDSCGALVYPWCYRDVEIVENGPERFCARLTFNPMVVDGDTIVEERVITLDAGSNLNHTTVTYHGQKKPLPLATGIALHGNGYTVCDENMHFMAYDEPTQGAGNGRVFIGAYLPVAADGMGVAVNDGVSHLMAYTTVSPGQSYSYYWGYGWERNNMPSMDAWIEYLRTFNTPMP